MTWKWRIRSQISCMWSYQKSSISKNKKMAKTHLHTRVFTPAIASAGYRTRGPSHFHYTVQVVDMQRCPKIKMLTSASYKIFSPEASVCQKCPTFPYGLWIITTCVSGTTCVNFTTRFYATSLSSIPIKEEVWTIVHTASTLYKR
jgi:hypothetical protein